MGYIQLKSDTIVVVGKDLHRHFNISSFNCCGQCYDWASNIIGHKMEDASQILEESPLTFLTHCYGHTLNLASGDMIRMERLLKDTMDTTNKLSKLNKCPLNGTQCFPDCKKNFFLVILD